MGQEVVKISQKVWPFFTGIPSTVKLFQSNWKEVLGSIWSLISNLVDRQIFSKIFDNIHARIGNMASFFFSSSSNGERDTFIGLFKGDKMTNTFSVLGFLLGQEIGKNKYFKARPNVFNYLLLSWMDNPKEVTKKIEKFSTTIKNLSDKLNGSSSSGKDGKNTYWLEIPLVREYLDIRKGDLSETLFDIFWPLEVKSKISNNGQNNTNGTGTWLQFSEFFF